MITDWILNLLAPAPSDLERKARFMAWLDKRVPELEPQVDWESFERMVTEELEKFGDAFARITERRIEELIKSCQRWPCKQCSLTDYPISHVTMLCGKCEVVNSYKVPPNYSGDTSYGHWQIDQVHGGIVEEIRVDNIEGPIMELGRTVDRAMQEDRDFLAETLRSYIQTQKTIRKLKLADSDPLGFHAGAPAPDCPLCDRRHWTECELEERLYMQPGDFQPESTPFSAPVIDPWWR